LHRTPDHIRHFMVGMAAPSFDDTIFDPACGTAGFLFDSFGYVLEAVSQDDHWPGERAHPELKAYFQKFFSKHKTPMPSQEKAITFYRTGIFGIEYLGMIRKMAAINFYIRGLNPQNIEQGDSLASFNPPRDAGTRNVVLANPPFGAERDQEAYPNVWEEFPRESETTILFVKLMLDALAPGGRCAVVVSEGFLSWDQTSARNLRKMLIQEANLKAIFSLPQGVFVSKGGVGPKTSILYFEKGEPTKEVWFYKVTNDGYTMGTNRRPIEGCQLVETLQLFNQYLRQGKTPPETKHSFSIPAEWILTLDPRIKQRIQTETSEDFNEKAAREKTKLEKKLKAQAKAGKISKNEIEARLLQHDEIWKNKTLNEIAKRIERAHLYSFNLSNYRCNLSQSQLKEWNDVFKRTSRRNGNSLDKRFVQLKDSAIQKAHTSLALFNIKNALEFDICRQYLMSFSTDELAIHNHLAELRKIIESGAKYPRVKLGEYLKLNTDKTKPSEYPNIRFRVLGVSNTKGVFLNETLPGAEIKQAYYRVKPNDFCYNPYRVNVGSIGLNEYDYDNQIISGAYNVFSTDETVLSPQYLMVLFKSPQFLEYVNDKAHGGVRMNFKFECLEEWEIPLPSFDKQQEFVEEINKAFQVIKHSDALLSGWKPEFLISNDVKTVRLEEIAELFSGGTPARKRPKYWGGDIPWVKTGEISFNTIKDTEERITSIGLKESSARIAPEGSLLLALYGQGVTRGRVAILGIEAAINQACLAILPNQKRIYPNFLFFHLMSQYERIRSLSHGTNQANLNATMIKNLRIPLLPLDIQIQLATNAENQMIVNAGIKERAESAKRKISKITQIVFGD